MNETLLICQVRLGNGLSVFLLLFICKVQIKSILANMEKIIDNLFGMC